MSPTLFERGIEIMLLGMGTVIAFLSLLVVAIGLMHRLLERFYPAPEPTASTDSTAALSRGGPTQPELIAVIAAALHRHRRQCSPTTGPRQEDASHG